jgi:cell division protein FtsB
VGRLKRFVMPGLLLLALYWAVFGGEYSIFEVGRARRARELEALELEQMRTEIDSLRAWTSSLEEDLRTLEQLARERFGMIRDGETLYLFAEPDSGSRRDPLR